MKRNSHRKIQTATTFTHMMKAETYTGIYIYRQVFTYIYIVVYTHISWWRHYASPLRIRCWSLFWGIAYHQWQIFIGNWRTLALIVASVEITYWILPVDGGCVHPGPIPATSRSRLRWTATRSTCNPWWTHRPLHPRSRSGRKGLWSTHTWEVGDGLNRHLRVG